jgi:thymidylate synthase
MEIIPSADFQYDAHTLDIIQNGGYVLDRTGTGTLKRWEKDFLFRPADEFPILTKKKVFFESAKKEMFWIYQDQSNDVNLLREKYGVKVWNEWADEEGTIGKAYGYQVKKHSLIDKLIHTLKTNPYDRGMVMSLWSNEDLEEMNLRPCAFQTIWNVDPITDELNMKLIQRSGDMGLGVPFNMVQYAILQIMIAHVTGLKVGYFKHSITDAHVYVNHINPLRKQLQRDETYNEEGEELSVGKIGLSPYTPKDFYKIKPEHIKLYNYVSHKNIKMKVSV